MKKYFYIIIASLCLLGACKSDDDFLDKKATNMLTPDLMFKDPKLVLSVIADFYDRYSDLERIDRIGEYANFDEAILAANGDTWRGGIYDYDYIWWNQWDYNYVRQMNTFLNTIQASTGLEDATKKRFLGEVRFLRASLYFEMGRRMGGVPLLTQPLEYDFSGDVTSLCRKRNTEAEIYDFVIAEMDTINSWLPNDPGEKSRASQGAALALQCRTALYAGSIAKYSSSTPVVTLPGGVVSIDASKATAYYQKALAAAKAITGYSLYKAKGITSDNFANIFLDKSSSNQEVIFVRDYKLKSGVIHGFTIDNQPMSGSEEGSTGGRLNPSLNLAMAFEKLDNKYAAFETNDPATGDYIYYDKPEDIFANRDLRLKGTILCPGSSFKGKPVDIFAGLLRKGASGKYTDVIPGGDVLGKILTVDGQQVQVVGKDGPLQNYEKNAQTGFYIRKYLDPTEGSGRIGTQSEVWWVRYRYAEVLMNAAEAAYELGDKATAAQYMNQVRERAGFTTPLQASEITFDRIVHERRVEFAFEGLRIFDLKRWRLSHKVYNGQRIEFTDLDPSKADSPSPWVYGLSPFKIWDPGAANHNKYVFQVIRPQQVTNPHHWRMGNYYSRIPDDIMSKNSLLVQNPNQ